MALAISARLSVAHWDTVLPDPHGMAYLHGGLLLTGYRTYGTGRTNVGTLGTFGTAITTFV